MRILLVGGSWDKNGGKPSGLINKMYEELVNLYDKKDITFINGGNYDHLEKIIDTAPLYKVIYWMAYVPNDLPKVRDIKRINPYAIVVGSKRNDDKKYTFVEILNRALLQKHNLTIEFSKVNNKFNMLVFDPLGTAWYDGDNLKDMIMALNKRIEFVLSTKRDHTYESQENITVPNNEEFFDYVRKCSNIFQETIEHAPGVTRFFGNASFVGDDRKYVYMSQRDVDKCNLDKNHFVCTYEKDDKVYYTGKVKPSKDTIVQIKLYKTLKNIKYIIHSHCYIKNAPFTNNPVPCGTLDEYPEIINVIKTHYNNDCNLDYYAFNLIGHGCLVMANSVDKLKDAKFYTRHLPEYISKGEK